MILLALLMLTQTQIIFKKWRSDVIEGNPISLIATRNSFENERRKLAKLQKVSDKKSTSYHWYQCMCNSISNWTEITAKFPENHAALLLLAKSREISPRQIILINVASIAFQELEWNQNSVIFLSDFIAIFPPSCQLTLKIGCLGLYT